MTSRSIVGPVYLTASQRAYPLILRSLRSKRLEGWNATHRLAAILRDAAKTPLLRMGSKTASRPLRMRDKPTLTGALPLPRRPLSRPALFFRSASWPPRLSGREMTPRFSSGEIFGGRSSHQGAEAFARPRVLEHSSIDVGSLPAGHREPAGSDLVPAGRRRAWLYPCRPGISTRTNICVYATIANVRILRSCMNSLRIWIRSSSL